ncbi:alpha/beta hydrolase [Candidatus Pacearchaeota archaeon]|nr:alpha/beta hydrolase [Candidatus Pacearchaeota archaeon]
MDNINTIYHSGKKEPVLFIHGDLQNHTVFISLASFFQRKGHATLLFDLPGHGNSSAQNDLDTLLSEIINLYGLKNPIFIGHSFGGLLAADYIKKTGNASAAIFLNACIGEIKSARPNINVDEVFEYYQNLSKSNFKSQELIDYRKLRNATEKELSEIGLKSTFPESFKNNLLFYKKASNEEKLYNLEIPILYIATKDDEFIPLEYSKQCMKKMKNGRTVIEDGTHNSLIINPKLIENVIKDNYNFLVGQ